MVEPTGTINYPLLGRIQAVGFTLKELEQNIVKLLKSGYLVNPNVRATILAFRPVYVVGQVHRPGSYAYVEGLTAEKALALAGGTTPIASTSKIFVLRESATPNKREHAELDTPIFPGDTVIIEESLF
jgi:polysaccharide export outer membrane protein